MDVIDEMVDDIPTERPWEEINMALGNDTRRYVIYHFIEHEKDVENEERLAEEVVKRKKRDWVGWACIHRKRKNQVKTFNYSKTGGPWIYRIR